MKHGDFTSLARDYAASRPGYAPVVAETILALVDQRYRKPAAADIGAGTGIWTRQLYDAGMSDMRAVEPNDAMRAEGEAGNDSRSIVWLAGSGEDTGLPDSCVDLVTMASSFHWTNYNAAMLEFRRILRPKGVFAAVWNTRYLQANPLLYEIEEALRDSVPTLNRISSGRSDFTEGLNERMMTTDGFDGLLYIEGYHVERMSRERYLTAWRSVNDIQVQAGAEKFKTFMTYVENRTSDIEWIDATYQTRAWILRAI